MQAPRIHNNSSSGGGAEIRRGLLCVLLATLIGYFAGGFSPSPMSLPITILPIVTRYLSPLLFLSGAGLVLHGFYLNHKSSTSTSH